jgi:hypothetical protein
LLPDGVRVASESGSSRVDRIACAEDALEPRCTVDGPEGSNVVPIRPAGRSGAGKPSPDAIKQVKGFMVARITRADGNAETDVRALYRDYVAWQEGKGRRPLPETEIGAALVHLFKLAQIPFGPKDGRAIARELPSKPENELESPATSQNAGSFRGTCGNLPWETKQHHCKHLSAPTTADCLTAKYTAVAQTAENA